MQNPLARALLVALEPRLPPAVPPEDPWARLHRLLRGRPRALWRRLPAPSPFPPPHGAAWRAAHALATAAFPLLDDEAEISALRGADGFGLRILPQPTAHARLALEAALRPALDRLARVGGPHPPLAVSVRRTRSTLDHLLKRPCRAEVSVRLDRHPAARMTFGLEADGTVRHACWSSP